MKMTVTPTSSLSQAHADGEHFSFRILTSHVWMNRLQHCSSRNFPERPLSLTLPCENLLYMYLGLNTNICLPDSHITRNLKFMTLVVLFERESFIISGRVRYSSTTSIPSENIRLIHMLLIKKVVYNSLCLQATNHYPETSVTVFNQNFVCPHQRQSDATICKVL